MTEAEVVEKVRKRVADPRRATSAASWSGNYIDIAPRFDLASLDVVEDAKQRFGFPIPGLLARLWSEVANGGIGPGYGIYGVEGGMTDDMVDTPLPDLFLAWREYDEWIQIVGRKSAKRMIPICEWGCGTFSVIDASTQDGNMVLLVDGVHPVNQQVSFARWMEDWADGIDVGAPDYSKVRTPVPGW